MRHKIVPIFLLAAAYSVTLFCQSFTIMRQESLGLFINTPDFYRELFLDPFPISNLIGSFLVQFYANHYIGAAISALLVLLCYLAVNGIISRFCKYGPVIAATISCVVWWFVSNAHHPATAVSIILISGTLWLVFRLIPAYKSRPVPIISRRQQFFSCVIISMTALVISTNPGITKMERYAKVEYAASDYNWNFLLRVAAPKVASEEKAMIPYALLALNAKGELLEKVSEYPLSKDFGLDFGDERTYRDYHFRAVLYNVLGCPNEAAHNLFQSGMLLPHGTSFRTLRMLVQTYYSMGDSLMVVKYCNILDHSCTNKKFVRYFKDHPCPQRECNSAAESSSAPMIKTRDQMGNMLQLDKAGLNSQMAMDRYVCYFDMTNFQNQR